MLNDRDDRLPDAEIEPTDPIVLVETGHDPFGPLRSPARAGRGRLRLAALIVAVFVATHLAISGSFLWAIRRFKTSTPPVAVATQRMLRDLPATTSEETDPTPSERRIRDASRRAGDEEASRRKPRAEMATAQPRVEVERRTPPEPEPAEVAARPEPPPDAGADPFRKELDECVKVHKNMVSKLKDEARDKIRAGLASAEKRKDLAAIQRARAGLRQIDEQGRIPADPITMPLLKKRLDEDAHLQSVFERVEKAYVEIRDDRAAARVRAECDEFVEKLCSTDDDRFLRKQNLLRKGRYYVLPEAERVAFREYEATDLKYRKLDAAYQDAAAIEALRVRFHDAEQDLIAKRTIAQELRFQIDYGGLKGAELRFAKDQWTRAEDARILARGEFDKAFAALVKISPKQMQDVQQALDEKLHEYRDALVSLKGVMKDVAGKYRSALTPEVRNALQNLGLSIGPSEAYRGMQGTVGRAEKELKNMNIHLRPIDKSKVPKY